MNRTVPTTATILIVDDRAEGRETLEALCLQPGYHLEFACNGMEALAQTAALQPDLVLLDVMMPGMDGFEVCRRLRATPAIAEVPVIMVTALDDEDARLKGLEAGADDFVSRPFNRAELRARVRTITQLNRYRRLLIAQTKCSWVVDHADDGYLFVDAHDQIVYANARAHDYLAMDALDALPATDGFVQTARQAYNLEPLDAWMTWQTQGRTLPAAQPLYLVRPETSVSQAFWLQVETLWCSNRNEDGRLIRLRNVTEQRLQQRALWSFHAAIAHKLNTPLNGLLGALACLDDDPSTLPPEQLATLTRAVSKSAWRFTTTLHDILNYMRAPVLAQSGGSYPLRHLPDLVATLSASLAMDAVAVSLPPSLANARLALSPLAVEHILQEVLENTKKFHPKHTPHVQMTASQASHSALLLQIRDDGVTLSPEQLSQVWTPYYQAEKTPTGEVNGTGLGLALVATIVWSAGGTCRLRNREDRPGIIVELVLPCEAPWEPGHAEAPAV